MPVIIKEGPYLIQFFSADENEPPHVHVRRDNNIAKFWLNPVRLQNMGGFRGVEIRRIRRIIEDNEDTLLDAWNDYFGS